MLAPRLVHPAALASAVVGALLVGAVLSKSQAAMTSVQAHTPITRHTVATKGQTIYVAMGASDTVGVGSANPARDNWTAQLAQHLPRGARYLNLGVSGITLGPALSVELPRALSAHPTLVTVWLAVNDLNAQVPPGDYNRELDALLVALRKTGARVFVGNVPDLRLVPVYASAGVTPGQIDAAVRAYNTVISTQAARHGATVVDLYANSRAIIHSSQYISGDGFHPNRQGYALLANLFYRVMHQHGAL